MSDVLTPSTVSDEPDVGNRQPSDPRQTETVTDESRHPSDPPKRIGLILLGWIPTATVFAGLIAVAWFGHHNDWKLPKFGAITTTVSTDKPEWCDSHGVAEAECINCLPGLIEDPAKLEFCQVHGVHGCALDNPSLAETREPATVLPRDLDRAERALAIHPRRENLVLSQLPGSRIQFASVDAMQKAGVDVEPVQRLALTECIQAAGEVRYDATKTAHISPSADGIVRQIVVNVGDWVNKGDVLAVVDSQEVGQLKTDLLSALLDEQLTAAQVERVQRLAPSGAVSGKRLLEANTELQQATVAVEQAVRAFVNLGLAVDIGPLRSSDLARTKSVIRSIGMDQIKTESNSDNLIAVTAPLEGRIVDREITIGQVVDRGSQMFRIADTRTVWIDLRVSAEDAPLAKLGGQVRYQPDGIPGERRGQVTWISSDVDPQTRTVRVRAELTNENGELRNESFGHGEIVLRDEADAIVVPDSSVQWDGENTIVFVRDARFFEKERPKFFVARSVRVGVSQDGFTEIIAGVLPGEVVASSGSDVLRAQLLKNNLGAGCTCGH